MSPCPSSSCSRKTDFFIYDRLKWLAVIVLPAIGALYTGLSQIWSPPCAAQIPATITVLRTFPRAVRCIPPAQYNKDAAASMSDFNTYHGGL